MVDQLEPGHDSNRESSTEANALSMSSHFVFHAGQTQIHAAASNFDTAGRLSLYH